MYISDMSSAGHIMDMIARMKANMKRRRDPFDKDVQVGRRQLRPELLEPCPPELIEEIRAKAVRERARFNRIQAIFIALSMLVISILIWLTKQAP